MTITLIPVTNGHLPDLAAICHRAFDGLQTHHRTHRDVPDEHVGRIIIDGVATRPDYVGAAAVLDGRVVGSNFLLVADAVAGLGPITVEPSLQAAGVGKALMQWAIDEADRRGITQVRLFQEAINAASLSLYTSLGFRWRYAAAVMQPRAATADDPTIRPMTVDDLPDVDRLSREHGGFSRMNDARQLHAAGLPCFVRERDRRVVGYQVASFFGHAGAETIEDLLALVEHVAAAAPPPMAAFICPLNHDTLFAAALRRGGRTLKVLNAMARGGAEPRRGNWLPSIQC